MEKKFEVQIEDTRHHTWQGKLTVGEDVRPFRSELELMTLICGALNQEEEKQG